VLKRVLVNTVRYGLVDLVVIAIVFVLDSLGVNLINELTETIDTKFIVEGSMPYAMSEMTILKDSIYLLMPFEKYIYKLNSSDFSMNKLYEETALNMIPEIQSNSYYEVTNEIEKNHGEQHISY